MADNPMISEADKIRLKRLARLGAPTSTEQPDIDTDQAPQQADSPARVPSAAASRLLSSKSSESSRVSSPLPSTKLVSSTSTPATKKTGNASKQHPGSISSRKSLTPVGPRIVSSPAHSSPPSMSYFDWETTKISAIFAVTLTRSDAEASAWRLCWLKTLAEEIMEEEPERPKPLQTSIDLRDRLLIARLSLDPSLLAVSDDPDQLTILAGLPQDETVFEYLSGCWKRLYAAHRDLNRLAYSKEDKARWLASFDELKRLIISYSGMTLEDPTMFPQPAGRPTGPAEFLPLLLNVTPGPLSENSGTFTLDTSATGSTAIRGALYPTDLLPFLTDIAAGFPEDTLADVITPTLSLFFQEWFKISPTPDLLGVDWRRYLGAVSLIVQVKAIAALLPSLSVWIATEVTAPKIEWQSLLGPLTRLNVFPREFPEIWKTYFSNPTERQTADIDANKANLRHGLGALQSSLFTIYNSIVRASPDSREGILDFFAHIVKLNQKRAGMSVDYRMVSSDGFMFNIHTVLLKLLEPVMDIQFSKLDKVDTEYYRHTNRIDVNEETKISAAKEEADDFYGNVIAVDQKPNFISDIFFLLNSFQHLGVVKTISNRIKAERNISDAEKELKSVESRREEWSGNPATQAQGDATIAKLKGDIATLHASIHAYDTQLLDPTFTRANVTFCGFVMNWLLRLVDPKHQHPQVSIMLPLPTESPLQFRMLPEFLFDNVTEYYDFLSRYNPDALDNSDKDIFVTFAITFLAPAYVNNPFLKAKLVSILANGLWPVGYHRRGPLFDRLSIHPLSTEFLMPTLIRFFIDVEMTGGHTQFWDKFNFRRDISRIIKSMWANPLHREAFVKSRHDNFDQFIKFVNMLMSDATFHLEESLTNLSKINSIRGQQTDRSTWMSLPQSEREDLESQMRQAESQAPFHTQMGRDHVELIRDLTATTKEPFLTGEIVDRLAASLDENLANLVGPKMQDLKLSDPERFSFKPKQLLAGIAQIYLNLGHEPDFIRAVANDGRSYSKDLFERFARVLKHRAIMTDAEVAGIVTFTQRIEDAKATIVIEDEREIPDEFLDPLLATLMKDPVILPVSRVTLDRSTIRAVLLSKEHDPFNNVPLKYEDIIPDVELKNKIDAWMAEGKNEKPQEVMDLDEL